MPELPEVETVRRGLLPVMEGQRIDQAQVNRPDLRFALPPNMAARLTGQVVQTLLFCAGPGGLQRLEASLMDGSR